MHKFKLSRRLQENLHPKIHFQEKVMMMLHHHPVQPKTELVMMMDGNLAERKTEEAGIGKCQRQFKNIV